MATTYEGIYYQASVIKSNRTGTRIEITGMGDGVLYVPASQVAPIKAQLESGISPDAIAQQLPIDYA